MTEQPAPGIYERLVTRDLASQLQQVPAELLELRELEDADSHEVLARYLSRLIARALRATPGHEKSRVENQLARANAVIDELQRLAPDSVDSDADVVAKARELMAVLSEPLAAGRPRSMPRA